MSSRYAEILQRAIETGIARKQGEQRLKMDKDRQDAEIQFRNEQLRQQQENIDRQAEYTQALIKQLSQQAATSLIKSKMDIAQQAQQGISVPGVDVKPGMDVLGNMFPINGARPVQQQVTLPKELGGDVLTQKTPEEFAKQQAQQKRILMAPELEARRDELTFQDSLIGKREEKNDQRDYQKLLMQKGWEEHFRTMEIEADNERNRLSRESQERIARMHWGNQNAANSIQLQPYAEDAFNGKLSVDDIKKLPIPKEDQFKVLSAVTGSGARVLTKDQKEFLDEFPQLIRTIPIMDELIENQRETTNKVSGAISGAADYVFNQDVTVPEQELKARAGPISRFLKEKGNNSNADIQRVLGMIPGSFNAKTANIKKRNDFFNELNNLIDTRLSNVPQAQRNLIKKNMGLFDIKPYAPKGQQSQGKAFKVGSRTFNIPAAEVEEFLKENPGAQEVKK